MKIIHGKIVDCQSILVGEKFVRIQRRNQKFVHISVWLGTEKLKDLDNCKPNDYRNYYTSGKIGMVEPPNAFFCSHFFYSFPTK